ncbi:MAG: hypothetical protein Q7T51_02045 [Candidatus Moranbacteria bacterium]|nr:hypothetical protein [Candidatus Moranbacteria bacterium]
MKLKLLFAPVIMLYGLYLVIWVIIPAYAGQNGVNSAKDNLVKAEARLVDINMKGENAVKLANDLNYNSDQQTVLRQYLPDAKQDEEVINSLNSIASSADLLIASISTKDVLKDAKIKNAEVVDGMLDAPSTESLVDNFKVEIEIAGDYGEIKKFILLLSALKRFNNISALEIKRDANADDDTLMAKVIVTFNYLNKITSVANVDRKIFADGKFDMNVVEDIKNKTSVDMSKVDAGSLGRSNPFVL